MRIPLATALAEELLFRGALLSTAVAGGVFAWLRLRSRSLLAPVLAHAAVNVSAYLAGRRTASRQAGLTAGPGAAGPRARPARERS